MLNFQAIWSIHCWIKSSPHFPLTTLVSAGWLVKRRRVAFFLLRAYAHDCHAIDVRSPVSPQRRCKGPLATQMDASVKDRPLQFHRHHCHRAVRIGPSRQPLDVAANRPCRQPARINPPATRSVPDQMALATNVSRSRESRISVAQFRSKTRYYLCMSLDWRLS